MRRHPGHLPSVRAAGESRPTSRAPSGRRTCCARPLHVTAVPQVHQALLAAAAALGADGALSADGKAYRIYHDRLHLAVMIAALPPDGRPYPPDLTAYDALLTTSGR
jgi:hypothetical protein